MRALNKKIIIKNLIAKQQIFAKQIVKNIILYY